MADNDEDVIVFLLIAVVAIIALIAIIFAFVWIIGIVIAIGATVGSSISLYNYSVAIKNNVKLEKPSI